MTSDACELSYETVRVAVRLPLPANLAELEPVRKIGEDGFAVVELGPTPVARVQRLLDAARAGFGVVGAPRCVGVCTVPRIKAVFFDLDSTVIAQETIVELARAAGKADEVAAVTERAMRGELDFAASLHARVATLEGLPARILEDVAVRLTLERGIVDFAQFAAVTKVPLFVVSGGFMPVVAHVTRPLRLAAYRANELGVHDGKLTGRVVGDVVDAQAKLDFVREHCRALSLSPAEVAAVGDGANDLLMLGAVGTAVGFSPKPALYPHVHAVTNDHAFLGPLLFGRGVTVTRGKHG